MAGRLMIAIGCATTDERAFRAAAARAVEQLDEGSSVLLRRHGAGPVDASYNDMLDAVAGRDDLEAAVLLHEDTVVEPRAPVLAQIRGLLAGNPDVAVIGTVDGGPARDLAAVDATLIALSPWAVANLRFDPAVGGAPDVAIQDLALQARAAGRRVLGAPLSATRASPRRTARTARQRHLHALVALRRKWDPDGLAA